MDLSTQESWAYSYNLIRFMMVANIRVKPTIYRPSLQYHVGQGALY